MADLMHSAQAKRPVIFVTLTHDVVESFVFLFESAGHKPRVRYGRYA